MWTRLRSLLPGARAPAPPPYVPRLRNAPARAAAEAPRIGLLTPGEAAEAARRIAADHPHWRTRTLALVDGWRREGLPIYGTRGAPLDARFPWLGASVAVDGDVMYRIRPHRFAFAPQMALAALYDPARRDWFGDVIEGWVAAVDGRADTPAYETTLLVAQRLIALDWARAVLSAHRPGGDARDRLPALIASIVGADIDYLLPRLGQAVANNHLLAERFIAWYLEIAYPDLATPPEDPQQTERQWLLELERQTLPDGAGFEHSLHYHEYACELTVAYVLLCRRRGTPEPDWVTGRLERMLRFQCAATGRRAPLRLGNAAEDPLLPLDTDPGWSQPAWRALLASLFDVGQADFSHPNAEKAFWLAAAAPGRLPAHAATTARPAMYAHGGLLRIDDTRPDLTLWLRTGAAAHDPAFGGHMHADLLALYASAGAEDFLVDAGTCTYRHLQAQPLHNDGPTWRAYFAGPAAHNGFNLPPHDPLGPLTGDFRNRAPAARVQTQGPHAGAGLTLVQARIESTNCYRDCTRGLLAVTGQYALVWNRLPAQAGPAPELRLQFAADVALETTPDGIVIARLRADALRLIPGSPGAPPGILRGSLAPCGGWVSAAYGSMQAAPQVRLEFAPGQDMRMFVLQSAHAAPVASIESCAADAGSVRAIVRGAGGEDEIVVFPAAAGSVNVEGLTLRARAIWLRRHDGRLRSLRACGVEEIRARDRAAPFVAADPADAARLGTLGLPPVVRSAAPGELHLESR
ncbi:MAG: heparinase II/III family protein [Gammaproteobacteria bacterium]